MTKPTRRSDAAAAFVAALRARGRTITFSPERGAIARLKGGQHVMHIGRSSSRAHAERMIPPWKHS